jgi:Na+-translocating ferredoxin:NAD+ oxidoreductase RnfE subunit
MSGWLRYLTLKAQVSTGLNSQIVIWAIIAVIAAVVTFVFLLVAAFLWLADLYDGVIGAVFAVVAAIAAVACVMIRRHNMESARLELAARSSAAPLLDPKLLGMGYQIGQTIGWRKLISLAAVGLLAAGLAREWVGRERSQADDDPDPDS